MRYIEEWRPLIVWMENVVNFLSSSSKATDLKVLIAKLNAFGYIMDYDILNPPDFYCPQSRARAHMWACPISRDPVNQLQEGFEFPQWFADIKLFINSCKGQATIPLADFLVSSDHPWVASHLAELSAIREKDRKGSGWERERE